MFFEKVVWPFIQPFRDLTEYIGAKLILVFGFVFADVTIGLFETPQQYWETLGYLVILDLLAKNLYIWTTENVKWNLELFVRKTIYKASSYAIVCVAFSIFSNQWEGDSNYFQYVVYLGLCVLEIISIAKHTRLTAFFVTFWKQLSSGNFNITSLIKQADKYSEQVDHHERKENVHDRNKIAGGEDDNT